MINLLPPTHKEQIRYAKYNRIALRYLRLVIVLIVVLGGIFGGTYYFVHLQSNQVASDVATKQQTIKSYAPFQIKAKDASDRLAAIKYVQASQTRFSHLLDDLAKVLPQGVIIESLTLTGSDKQPVKIAISADSYDSALAFRNALVLSPRVSGADLENIQQTGGSYEASVVVGFKPGEAK